jgi:hypothetical protein
MKAFLLIAGLVTLERSAHACPVCDVGSGDAAMFIVSLFGLFILGMIAFFVAFARSGGLATTAPAPDISPLEAEKKGACRDAHES